VIVADDPIGVGDSTYAEKTCCETSLAGFEFSAPMVEAADEWDAVAEVVGAGRSRKPALAMKTR
jgi:hypothetical protein